MIVDRFWAVDRFRRALDEVKFYREYEKNHGVRCVHTLKAALGWMQEALHDANRNGWPAKVNAPIFRAMNWIRAEIRRVEA